MIDFAEVNEGPPTPDQLGSILEYLGPSKAGSVIKEATGASDAMRRFGKDAKTFVSPVIVDWNRGKASKFTSDTCGESEGEVGSANIMCVQSWEMTRARY